MDSSDLLVQATTLLGQGRDADAAVLLGRVIETEPGHIEALNALAVVEIRAGRGDLARSLLGRASIAAGRDEPITLTNLGHACLLAGDWDGGLDAFSRALRSQPNNYVARLYQASIHERLGRRDLALYAYFHALKLAQENGRWLNEATTPPGLLQTVRHAIRYVVAGRREWFDRIIAPLRARYGLSELKRVEEALAIYLGDRPAQYQDPRQRPNFLYFPGLPASPYLDRQLFPWMDALEAATPAIRAELEGVMAGDIGREAVFGDAELERQNLRAVEGAPSWNGYYFYRHGLPVEANRLRCPETVKALERVPLARVPAHAPEVLFSVFTAGTHLLPHRGVTNTRLVAHLPLIVPTGCALSVAGQVHQWREGCGVVFDDTYEHEAWNRGNQTRVVLILDIWNPFLSDIEREAVASLVVAIGDFRVASETV